tara:strand:- start:603 stop:845 length:243 start_codon:yes stop_codon:yes gene_type:complete
MASIRKRGSKYEAQIRRTNCKSSTKSFINLSDAKKWARMMEVKADRNGSIPFAENPLDHLKKLKVNDVARNYKKNSRSFS